MAKLNRPLLLTQLTFIFVQFADFMTTMIALHTGGFEMNPFVSRLMVIGSLQGLILSKVVILGIAVAAVRLGKVRILRLINILFGAVVLWNLTVIARLALRARAG